MLVIMPLRTSMVFTAILSYISAIQVQCVLCVQGILAINYITSQNLQLYDNKG